MRLIHIVCVAMLGAISEDDSEDSRQRSSFACTIAQSSVHLLGVACAFMLGFCCVSAKVKSMKRIPNKTFDITLVGAFVYPAGRLSARTGGQANN